MSARTRIRACAILACVKEKASKELDQCVYFAMTTTTQDYRPNALGAQLRRMKRFNFREIRGLGRFVISRRPSCSPAHADAVIEVMHAFVRNGSALEFQREVGCLSGFFNETMEFEVVRQRTAGKSDSKIWERSSRLCLLCATSAPSNS